MTRITTVRDAGNTSLTGIEDALLHRMNPSQPVTDNGRRYAALTLVEMARELLALQGHNTAGMDRMAVATLAVQQRSAGMHTLSDFPGLLANVGTKRLRQVYNENTGSYRVWARRALDATDFRPMNVVAVSSMPDLLRISEAGEFKYGTVQAANESYALLTSGRIVHLSRQTIINDDLRAFARIVEGYAAAAARLENRAAYAQLTGTDLMGDGLPLFHASRNNLGTGGGSALQLTALSSARTLMRQQKGMQGEELNIAPSFLIGPAALEQLMYQLTSPALVPATVGAVNEFRQGGRSSLVPVVEPLLDGVSQSMWFLAAATAQIDTVEYCFLEGNEAPVIEVKPGFAVDGVQLKCRHDFAVKAVEWRGLYRANGA
jgi:hypothetical protein